MNYKIFLLLSLTLIMIEPVRASDQSELIQSFRLLLGRVQLILQPTSPFEYSNTDSLNIRLIGRWAHGTCLAVAVTGDTAYFGNGAVLEIVDFTNPGNPALPRELILPAPILNITIFGRDAYIADSYAGLRIIDISDCAKPVEKGNFIPDLGYTTDVAIHGSFAYLANTVGGIYILDISDPTNPEMIKNIRHASPMGIASKGNHMYVVHYYKGMEVIDVEQ